MENGEINFIKDEEINLETNDLLGTKPYVNTLYKIIQNVETPFTIGLFGGWGTGKSSIINTIQKQFEKNDKSNIEVFIYDAWKYSNDSFRRSFLNELKKRFKLKPTEKLDSFYQDKHEEIATKIGFSKLSWVYFLIFILSIVLINLAQKLDGKELEWTTFVISIFISGIITFVSKSFVQYKISITKPKLFAPEQFEEAFKDAISIIRTKKSIFNWFKFWDNTVYAKEIVIVIDNIDRCHEDLAFDLLLTIKTFLEQEGIVFIVPIDDKQLSKHIKKRGNDPKEFLRKLFNTTIKIKLISEKDLSDFAKELNENNKLNFPEDVLTLVANKFSGNPRRIIQFMNILQTEFLLAEEQEKNGILPLGSITDNLPFFTKVLMIREEYPKDYKKIAESPYLLGGTYYEEDDFFRRTAHVTCKHDNYELFFNNRNEKSNVLNKTEKYINTKDLKSIKEQLELKEIEFDELIKFIDSKFENIYPRKESLQSDLINIADLLFEMMSDEDFKKMTIATYSSNEKTLGGFRKYIDSFEFSTILLKIDANLVLTFISENEAITGKLFSTIVGQINRDGNYKDFLIDYIRIFNKDPEKLKIVSNIFSEWTRDIDYAYKVLPGISTKEILKNLVSYEMLERAIDKLNGLNSNFSRETVFSVKFLSIYFLKVGLTREKLEIVINKLLNGINKIEKKTDSIEDKTKKHPELIIFGAKKKPDTTEDRLDYSRYSLIIQNLILFIENTDAEYIKSKIQRSLNINESWLVDYSRDDTDSEVLIQLFLLAEIKLFHSFKSKDKKESILKSLQTHFRNKETSIESKILINELFYEIVDKKILEKWDFVFDLTSSLSISSEKKLDHKIAKTLNLMLKNTTDDEGLSVREIKTIFSRYLLCNDRERTDKWILDSLDNKYLIKFLDEEIKHNDELSFGFIGLLIKMEKEDMVVRSIIKELKSATTCFELEWIFNEVKEKNNKKELIIESVKAALADMEKRDDLIHCFIEELIKYSFLDEEIQQFIDKNEKGK